MALVMKDSDPPAASSTVLNTPYDTVAAMIESRFREVHAADIQCQYKELIVCTDGEGREVLAAAGIRRPEQRFYLEHYLPTSAQACVSTLRQRAIPREHLVEVGNFVAFQGRAAFVLMHSLFRFLQRANFRHIVMTCTGQLRRSFKGMPMHRLAAAHQHRVDTPQQWGSYYQQGPEVITGQLSHYDQRFARFNRQNALRCYYVNQSGESDVL